MLQLQHEILASEESAPLAEVRVIVVSFEPAERLARYVAAFEPPLPAQFHFVADVSRELYGLYGTGVASLRRAVSLGTILFYAKGLLRGRRPWRELPQAGEVRGDRRQLGGDFVVDSSGRVALAHVSTTPADRPPMNAVRQAIVSIATA